MRKLLIIGAMARLTVRGRKSVPTGSWLARMLAKKPKLLVAIALANRMARLLWVAQVVCLRPAPRDGARSDQPGRMACCRFRGQQVKLA